VEGAVAYAAHGALQGKRHDDFYGVVVAREPALFEPDVLIVNVQSPGAVQVQPIGPDELRTRIFGAGKGGIHEMSGPVV